MFFFIIQLVAVCLILIMTSSYFVFTIAKIINNKCWQLVASGIFLILATIPATVLAMLLYALYADPQWLFKGPGIYSFVTGGPSTAAFVILTATWFFGCITYSSRLARDFFIQKK